MHGPQTTALEDGRDDVAMLVSALGDRDAQIATLKDENARLWRSYNQLKEELALLKRRIFIAKAERIDTTSMQLELADLVLKLDALSGEIPTPDEGTVETPRRGDKSTRERSKPTGRRRLEDADLPEVPVEIPDELFEKLVAEGKAERIGFEISYKLGRERGGLRRVAVKRVKYRTVNAQGEPELETAAVPPELIPRCMVSASTLAFIATSKYCDGLPLYRIEQIFDRDGFPLDRGSMSRWIEHMGATFGVHRPRLPG